MNQTDIKPLQILKASAGSGKTFQLTVRFIILLLSGNNKYRRIMAVTFTNKATAEMKHRILSVLEGFARGEWENNEGYLKEIGAIYPEWSKEDLQEKARYVYRQILHDYGRLTITTIDKFIQQIIRSFTFELGIASDYRVTLNMREVVADLTEMLHDTLTQKPDLLQWIIDYAREEINKGKSWNYQRGLSALAYQIFTEDFQAFDDATREKMDAQLFSVVLQEIKTTKQNFENEIKAHLSDIREMFIKITSSENFFKGKSRNALYTTFKKESEAFFKKDPDKVLAKLFALEGQPEKWFNKNQIEENIWFYEFAQPILEEMHRVYEENRGAYFLAMAIEANLYFLRLMKEMSNLLNVYRADKHLLLISDATRLLNGITQGMGENLSFIWEKAGNRYQHFLFDEFQDTSRNQWQNFKPLVENALAQSSGKRIEHLIVGDVKQSIYRWRGGDWKILLNEAEADLGLNFVSTKSLIYNFRSDGRIIEFNKHIFPFLADWLQEQLNASVEEDAGLALYEGFWQAKGWDQTIKAAYHDVVQELPDQFKAAKANKGIVDWIVIPTETNNKGRLNKLKPAIMARIAEQLHRWLVKEKRYQAGQIGILVRKNKEAQELLQYLKNYQREQGTPKAYDIVSGDAQKLKDNTAIKLIIETFRLLQNLKSEPLPFAIICLSLWHTLKTEAAPLPAEDWMKIGQIKHLKEFVDYLPKVICQEPQSLVTLPLSVFVEALIGEYGLQQNIAALPYLLAFQDMVAEYTAMEGTDFPAFLEWWDFQDDPALPASEDNNAVKIMTVHKAKGLAFDVVILPFLFWEFKPSHRDNVWVDMKETDFRDLGKVPLNNGKNFAQSSVCEQYYEERLYGYMDALNTLYVAMTRAKHHLSLCLPGQKNEEFPKAFVAGDALIAALTDYKLKNEKELIFPEEEVKQAQKDDQTTKETNILLGEYLMSQHLNAQLQQTSGNQLERLDNNPNIRIGIIVHELMAHYHSVAGVDAELNKLYQEGWFSHKTLPKIREIALRVFEHEGLQQLLGLSGHFLNERDLIDQNGQIYRPDKVLVREEETHIIDFKFTAKEKEAHFDQVNYYKKLFSEMNFPNVKGWLFYGYRGKLVKV